MTDVLRVGGFRMQMRIWCSCIALALISSVSFSFDQAPIYTKDNVLVGANYNDGSGSSDADGSITS